MWLAPEVLRNAETPDPTKIDVYAFGVHFLFYSILFLILTSFQVILYEITTRQDFFGNESFMTIVEEKVIKGERPPIPSDCPAILANLIEVCWDNGTLFFLHTYLPFVALYSFIYFLCRSVETPELFKDMR